VKLCVARFDGCQTFLDSLKAMASSQFTENNFSLTPFREAVVYFGVGGVTETLPSPRLREVEEVGVGRVRGFKEDFMATSTRHNAIIERLLGSPPSEEPHAIIKNCKGHQIKILTSLINERWEAWAQIPVGRETRDTTVLSILTLGHKTEHEAQKEIWEEAERKIAEISNRNSTRITR